VLSLDWSKTAKDLRSCLNFSLISFLKSCLKCFFGDAMIQGKTKFPFPAGFFFLILKRCKYLAKGLLNIFKINCYQEVGFIEKFGLLAGQNFFNDCQLNLMCHWFSDVNNLRNHFTFIIASKTSVIRRHFFDGIMWRKPCTRTLIVPVLTLNGVVIFCPSKQTQQSTGVIVKHYSAGTG
jgi:hypothetical protein